MSLEYLFRRPDRVWNLTLEHLSLSATAILVAVLVAIPLGILATRYRRLTLPTISLLGALYTVPSLAFLAFLIPSLGIGREPVLVMLVAYAQLFIVRNIVAGLRGVDASVLEAGRGLGMTNWQLFRQVRFPLALPVAISGVRTASVTTISLATVGVWMDAGGLGTLIFEAIPRRDSSRVLAGALAIVALALLIDALFRLAERSTAVSRARRVSA